MLDPIKILESLRLQAIRENDDNLIIQSLAWNILNNAVKHLEGRPDLIAEKTPKYLISGSYSEGID